MSPVRKHWISCARINWSENNQMAQTSLDEINQTYLDRVETELQVAIDRVKVFGNTKLHAMLSYHMGWNDGEKLSDTRGKRIRPLLVLLTCAAAGGEWASAIHGATAVELVHNFSLIHDDIEDHSTLRRGRMTVWKKWGIPQAINTGDAMFALAHLEVIHMAGSLASSLGLKAVEILQSACLHLTHGQYLDLAYESRKDLSVDDYWPMIEGKTAALMAASAELGALAASQSDEGCSLYRDFGRLVGLAFQVQDDMLGIWGNSSLTGKSSQSDLVTGKLTLPVLYGLSQNGEFAKRWRLGPIKPNEVAETRNLLEREGGKECTFSHATRLLSEAQTVLDHARPKGSAADALRNLAIGLVNRQS